mgnify:CR=1 FL=1
MSIQHLEAHVLDGREYVVEQETNFHAPVGGPEQGARKHVTSRVRLHQEILRVDALFRPLDQADSRAQRRHAVDQRVEAGGSGVFGQPAIDGVL